MSDRRTEDRHGKSRRRREERSRSRSPRNHDKYASETNSTQKEEKKQENVSLGAKNRLKSMSIQMKLGSMKSGPQTNKPKLTVASAFNQDSDEEPEIMPPEARMRMRNIGRDTPTSSGPNSFGKTKQGFSDAKKLFEKHLKEAVDKAVADD